MLLNLVGEYAPHAFVWLQVLLSAFFAILFLQSGIDKVTDRKGNLEWLTGHFASSPLRGMVPMLLTVITFVEIAAGASSGAAIVEVVVFRGFNLALIGTSLSAVALLMLFFGQRLAKDYAGAGALVSYFILAIINLYFLA